GASIFFDVTSYGSGSTGPRIERIGPDGSGRAVLVPEGYSPSVSADGRLLSYLQRESNGLSIHVRDLSTSSEQTPLAAGTFDLISPTLSPDGSEIVYATPAPDLGADGCAAPTGSLPWLQTPTALAHGTPKEIWRIAVSGGAAVRLTSGLCLD